VTSLLERIEARDTTLWPEGNVAAGRLGWLDVAGRMQTEAADLEGWARSVESERIVLLGMGGSSLGPEVLRSAAASDRLVVLDTTDPRSVAEVPLDDAFFLVSSKSGTTLEVNALLAHCWARVPDGRRYAAVTDPGTPLARLAGERGFLRVFENPPDIGGRYSVLSYFGLVPAALLGHDVAALCGAALAVDRKEAVSFGAAFGAAALAGADKLTIVVPEAWAAFGLWVEQLVAESTGKRGTGCIPVPTIQAEAGADRHVVEVAISTAEELGAQFFRWELATAAAGHLLGIDPFDEPNVAESKANTARVLEHLPLPSPPAADPAGTIAWLADNVGPGDYVSFQVYLPYGQDDALAALRTQVRDRLGGAPVTIGYGPRFLHSTGQLHKGGPASVVAVQVVPNHPTARLEVPGFGYDFATLIAAQALGDLESLRSHGRRVLRIAADHLQEVA
jgi:hypothetical protein